MKSNFIKGNRFIVNPFNYSRYDCRAVKGSIYLLDKSSANRSYYPRSVFDYEISFRIVLCKEVPYASKKCNM